jgi:hypothetical protein
VIGAPRPPTTVPACVAWPPSAAIRIVNAGFAQLLDNACRRTRTLTESLHTRLAHGHRVAMRMSGLVGDRSDDRMASAARKPRPPQLVYGAAANEAQVLDLLVSLPLMRRSGLRARPAWGGTLAGSFIASVNGLINQSYTAELPPYQWDFTDCAAVWERNRQARRGLARSVP